MSKKIFIVKSSTGFLLPGDAEAEEVVNKWKVGSSYSLTYAPARNPKFHRLVFAVASAVTDNAPEGSCWNGKDAYHFIKAVELQAGFVDELVDLNGEVRMVPKSIAFENMAEDEFKKLFDVLISEGARILGMTERELLEGAEVA
ncbi:MAG TPA: DUF1367 family protein [Candidatus Omnitrophota bacterium]|nr:DUF1367 family protein [Candidatus Omnitrophota bacterium]